MRITLFIPCFVDLMYPRVGISMVRILEKLGHQVECPESPACCGQPAFNTGYWDESRSVAVKALEAFKDAEVVVIASGSCGAMMKVFYPELFAGTQHEAMARDLAPKMSRVLLVPCQRARRDRPGRALSTHRHRPRRLPRVARIGQQTAATGTARQGSRAGTRGNGRGRNLLWFRGHFLGEVPRHLHRDG